MTTFLYIFRICLFVVILFEVPTFILTSIVDGITTFSTLSNYNLSSFSNRVSLISLTVNAMIVLRVIQCGFRVITAILTAFIRTSIEYL